ARVQNRVGRTSSKNEIFLSARVGDYNPVSMDQLPPHAVTPFVFSDPAGKRWPRLRLLFVLGSILALLGTVVFVQTLFVAPQMRVPVTLRQLKGQLKALQTQNPAGPPSAASL